MSESLTELPSQSGTVPPQPAGRSRAISLIGAVATLAVTLAADVAYAVADPRVRDGTSP